MESSKRMYQIGLALVLGAATVALISFCATRLHSSIILNLTDAASFPGFLIARVFYPAGVHTGGGAPLWAIVFLLSNALFYAALWFAVLLGAQLAKRHAAR